MLIKQRALFLVNRYARRGQQNLNLAIRMLKEMGFILVEPEIEISTSLSDVIRHYQGQVDLVIIGGGDGTLNACVEGLVETDLPLGILPLGTANDLARTLGIPVTIADACRVIGARHVTAIDLGWVNGKYFFNVASLGLSVSITEHLTKEAKRRWGVLAYGVAAVQTLWKTRLFMAEIRCGDRVELVKTIQVAVGNGRYYGGGLAVADDAAITDERLDLYSLEINRWWQLLKLLPALYRGNHHVLPFVHSQQGQEFFVCTRKPLPINTDGEITSKTPAHFKVVPKALSVLMPED
jgi:diacylglycerol kinase (ATP)